MPNTKTVATIITLSVCLITSGQTFAAKKQPTQEQRIKRLERMLDNKGLVNLLFRLENLQKEVQLLRGEVEMQTHTLQGIKKRQRELYVDIDRRLLKLERGSTGSTVPPIATTNNGNVKDANKGSASFAKEQKAYQNAFELLRGGRYKKSITAFRQFLKDYPDGRYAHIAQYWLGAANYTQNNFPAAIKEYTLLITKHPKSPKVPEAMLKIGYSYKELKDFKNVKASMERLIQQFPKSTEAGQAKKLLQEIAAKAPKKG